MEKKELARLALNARKHAYAPYSNFLVGAAILAANGKVYEACNVENASYGLTICAERAATLKAVYDGTGQFKAIAIAGYPASVEKNTDSFAFPCGACRQVLREFAAKDMKVYVVANEDNIKEYTLEELLPHSFGPDNLS
ncbi:MAG: cytidine deaminase [Spirochaetaceae bacterium]|nr:cytidine deaminase [Spirochaetaceae bacterium]